MASKIQIRRDTASNWSNNNTQLASGEPGFETDTGKFKIGNGSSYWNDLDYAGGSSGVTNNNSVAIGTYAGENNQCEQSVAIGYQAAQNNQSCRAVSIGYRAGQCCQRYSAVAIGNYAGRCNQYCGSVAIGEYSGRNSQGQHSIAIGSCAGNCNQHWVATAIGRAAGNCSQATGATAIGHIAGYRCQGYHATAVGRGAGMYCQGDYSVAIGPYTAQYCQSDDSIAIGQEAGKYCQGQGPWMSGGAIAIGSYAGNCDQEYHAIAIGRDAGYCSQGFSAVAIGRSAGNCCQGHGAVAIGKMSGYCCQGDNAVAIGNYAGRCCQGNNAIAIGYYAAESDIWYTIEWASGDGSTNTIQITTNYDYAQIQPGMALYNNGYDGQVITAINGTTLTLDGTAPYGPVTGGQFQLAGRQGQNAIAIGAYAASKAQAPNSIVINSTGNDLPSAGSGTTVIQSLRQVTGSVPSGFKSVYWNPTTGELIVVTP